MKRKIRKEQTVIGWREYVDLPDWNVHHIRAKVDTGAKTSALHVEDIKRLSDSVIEFYIVTREKNPRRRKKVHARIIKKGKVRSSTGSRTERWYVHTHIKLGSVIKDIAVNLVDRKGMNFRMLLGRTAIAETFLVDVERSFLLSKKRKKGNT